MSEPIQEDLDAAAHVQQLARRLHQLEQARDELATPSDGLTKADGEAIGRALEKLDGELGDTRSELKSLGARVNSLARHLVNIGAKVGYDFPKTTEGT